MARELPPPLIVTEAAKNRICEMVENNSGMIGLRIGVKTAGCSGLAYTAELAPSAQPSDRVIHLGKAQLFIDGKAEMYLIGTEMDYVTTSLKSGFEFRNPNEGARCGCGESFSLKNSQH
jgi:iron-sulfur cluster assembly protein